MNMLYDSRKFALKNGLILSFFLIVITTSFYLVDSKQLHTNILHNILFYCMLLLWPILIMNKFILSRTFKNIFSVVFLVLAISLFIYMLYTLFLYNIIDPALILDYAELFSSLQVQKDPSGNNSDTLYLLYLQNFSLKNQFNAYIFSLMPCGLYSTLVSLFLKK